MLKVTGTREVVSRTNKKFLTLDCRDRNLFPLCHLERVQEANATKDESKDPENTSSAMPRQGILPKLLPSLFHGKQNDCEEKSFERTP